MLARTHIMIGLSTLYSLSLLPGVVSADTIAPLTTAVAFGSLLPDLDAAQSTIKSLQVMKIQPFVPLAQVAHSAFGHRGFLHSPLTLALLLVLVVPAGLWWGWPT